MKLANFKFPAVTLPLSVALSMAVSAVSHASARESLVGVYSQSVSVASPLSSPSECEEENGDWSEMNGCVITTSNIVRVAATAGPGFQLAIETVEPSGHSCEFSAEATLVNSKTLRARTDVVNHNYDPVLGKVKPVAAVCEVTVKFKNSSVIDQVVDNGECQSFCGARATLEMSEAKKN